MCNASGLPPIGQGCNAIDITDEGKRKWFVGMCEEHFWLHLNVCLACGNKFHSKREGAKTCSDKCRKRLSRDRHATFFQTILKYANGESF